VPSTSTVQVPHSPSSHPLLRAREPQVLAQHFEQRLVRRERDLYGLAVQLERNLRFGIGHRSKRNLDNRVVGRQLSRSPSPTGIPCA